MKSLYDECVVLVSFRVASFLFFHLLFSVFFVFFFFQAEDGIRDLTVTGVQTCALPISVERERDELLGYVRAARPCRGVPGAASGHRTGATVRPCRRDERACPGERDRGAVGCGGDCGPAWLQRPRRSPADQPCDVPANVHSAGLRALLAVPLAAVGRRR